MKNSFLQFEKSLSVPKEEKEPVVFDFQDPSPPPMKAVNIRTAHHSPVKEIWTHVFGRVEKNSSFHKCEITYLSSVGSISWKYLTPKRPHDAKTEPFFSRSPKERKVFFGEETF